MPLLMGDTGLDGSRTRVGMDSTHIPVVRPSALTYLLCGLSQVIFTPEYSVASLFKRDKVPARVYSDSRMSDVFK